MEEADLARAPEAMVLRVVSHGLYQRQQDRNVECLEVLLVFPRAVGTTRALHEVNIRMISESKLFGLHRNAEDYCVGATQWSQYEVTGLLSIGRRLVFVHRSGGKDLDHSISLPIAHILKE